MRPRLCLLLAAIAVLILSSAPGRAQGAEPEDFEDFLCRFFSDGPFQVERIRWPLTHEEWNPVDEEFTRTITRAEWQRDPIWSYAPSLIGDYLRYHCAGGTAEFLYSTFDNPEREPPRSDRRVLAIQGNGFGVSHDLFFEREGGRWYLVKYESSEV